MKGEKKIDEGLIFGLVVTVGITVMVLVACAGAVAAPGPTPVPTKIPTPWPTYTPVPKWTPDLLFEELKMNMGVCLVSSHQFQTTLPTGSRVAEMTIYFFVGDSANERVHMMPIEPSVWLPYEGYREFLGVSQVGLADFNHVVVSIKIDGSRFQLHFKLEKCPPPASLKPL